MDTSSSENETLLTPAEVAALFRVDPKTVTRWARSGKLSAIRTLGGHRRFLESEVLALMGVPGPRTSATGREAGPGSAAVPQNAAAPHERRRGSSSSAARTRSDGAGPRRAAGA